MQMCRFYMFQRNDFRFSTTLDFSAKLDELNVMFTDGKLTGTAAKLN